MEINTYEIKDLNKIKFIDDITSQKILWTPEELKQYYRHTNITVWFITVWRIEFCYEKIHVKPYKKAYIFYAKNIRHLSYPCFTILNWENIKINNIKLKNKIHIHEWFYDYLDSINYHLTVKQYIHKYFTKIF